MHENYISFGNSKDPVTSVGKILSVSDSDVQINSEDSVVTSKSGRKIKPRSVFDL